MELSEFEIKVIDNFIELIPKDPLKDNSIYEIKLYDIKSKDGKSLSTSIKLCTKLSPLFSDIDAVKSIVEDCDIPDDVILYHIREASRFAEYIKGTKIDEEDVPFEITQFVKYKAAHECLLRHTIQQSSTTGLKGTIGNVAFEEKETIKDISQLLGHLCKEIDKWLDEVKGFKLEGRAKMKTAIKGINSSPQPIGLTFKRGV